MARMGGIIAEKIRRGVYAWQVIALDGERRELCRAAAFRFEKLASSAPEATKQKDDGGGYRDATMGDGGGENPDPPPPEGEPGT